MEPQSAVAYRQITEFNDVTDFESVKYIYQENFHPPFTLTMLRNRLGSAEKTWVYLLNNEIVGYLLLAREEGLPYLSQVATRDTARRKGVATGLIRQAESYLSGGGEKLWWLQVDVNNPAQKLYFDLGFRVSGFEPHLYGSFQHGIRMTKALQ